MDRVAETASLDAGCKDQFDLSTIHLAADVPDMSSATLFVASGLRAARAAQTPHRRLILADLAQVLSCSADELDFLFMEPAIAANDSDPVGMPDFRSSLLAAAQ